MRHITQYCGSFDAFHMTDLCIGKCTLRQAQAGREAVRAAGGAAGSRQRRPGLQNLRQVTSFNHFGNYRLAEKQPGLLEELQGHAKAWSNAGLLWVVFVLSDGPALSQMKRAQFPPCTALLRLPSEPVVGLVSY